jgi:hypothetical protein
VLSIKHRQHSKPIERKLLCILSVFLETHPPQAARGRCRFIKTWPTKSELRCAYYGRNKLAE